MGRACFWLGKTCPAMRNESDAMNELNRQGTVVVRGDARQRLGSGGM